MRLPEFTAELALGKSTRAYRGRTSHGSLAPVARATQANVRPSQFDAAEELGDMDGADFAEEAGAEDAGLEDIGDMGSDDLEGSEDADLAGDMGDLGDMGEG